ncbi:Hypothetical protein I5071_78990 [Sandaracinus amylolyticus]|nr:Hypothetical protein I5071_78990 [Sandaracinus amylolyticus]
MRVMPRCPKCSLALVATHHAALGCARCGGLWAREGALASLPDSLGGSGDPATRAPNDGRTGLCPDGHGILLRARIDDDEGAAFYLERCSACRGVWFDPGEWSRIASSDLRTKLDALWDPAARRAALTARNEARLAEDLRARLGDALHDRLVDLVRALESHPDRAMALAYIDEHLR